MFFNIAKRALRSSIERRNTTAGDLDALEDLVLVVTLTLDMISFIKLCIQLF